MACYNCFKLKVDQGIDRRKKVLEKCTWPFLLHILTLALNHPKIHIKKMPYKNI